MSTTIVEREYLTPPKVAQLLGKRVEWVHSEIRAGRLPALDLSAPDANRPTYHVRRADLDSYLESRLVVPAKAKSAARHRSFPKPRREYV